MSAAVALNNRHRRAHAVLVAVLTSCGTIAAQSPTLEQVLDQHVAHLGGRKALDAISDFVVEMTLQTRKPLSLRTFVRRQPFAIRQEIEDADSPAPYVRCSDGRHAWRVLPDGTTNLLTGEETRILLEAACVDGLLYLRGSTPSMRMILGPSQPLVMPPGVPPAPRDTRPVWPIAVMLPCGTEMRMYFDGIDGSLRGLANTSFAPQRNVRYGEVARFESLRWPATRWENEGAGVPLRGQVDAIRSGALDPALFPPSPLPALRGLVDAAPLLHRPTEVPGSWYFIVPDVDIDARGGVPALFDTGAGRIYLDTRLADRLALPILSQRRVRGITGMAETSQRWLESLALPGFRLAQLEVGTTLIPPTAQTANGTWPGIVLGGEVLAMSPVLDVQRGRLLLRGAPVEPLQGTSVFTVPLTRDHDLHALAIAIGGKHIDVVLDSGMAVPLRLSVKALQQAGLPTDAAAWRARGAVPLQMSGAGQGATHDLLVQIESFRLGQVVFERPWVSLALDAALPDAFAEAALGAGALAAFARVGLDLSAMRLELEPGDRLERTDDGWRLPSAGTFLGLRVRLEQQLEGKPADGLIVVEVPPSTPAAAAGIQVGERVVRIDGEPCTDLRPAWIERLWAPSGSCTIDVRGADGKERHLVLSR